jgi:photosystem II stability/assembly factor-like uncharacterized protein
MRNNSQTVRSKAAALPVAIVVAAITGGIFPRALVSPAMAQALNDPPRHVTPWTPMPVPGLRSAAPALVPGISLRSKHWTPIGPAPLAAGNDVSGRITGIATEPMNANIIYLAAAGGGVWKTTNGGISWTRLTDQQKTLSMGAIAIGTRQRHRDDDEKDEEDKGEHRDKEGGGAIVYAGTGEASNSGDSNFGRGILVSTDAGANWKLFTGPSNAFDRLTTSQIAVDPTDGRVAYAAMADLGINGLCCANTGIWKTTNGGKTWTNTTTSIESSLPWSAVVIDPNNNLTIYAAVGDIFGATTNGVYKSIDGGGTWTLLTNGPKGPPAGRIAIGVSQSNSQTLYVTASGTGSPGSTSFGTLYKIMRSDNGGNTFTDLTGGTPNFMGGQGWYDTYVIVDPSNSAIVYVAGAAGANSILRSTNSGVSWTDISAGGASPHVDHHASAFDANGKLLDGDDGGIYRLDNPAATIWTDLNGNLETIQFQGIGLHPTDRNKVIGGSQDNGTEIFTGNPVWTQTDGGDGGFAKFSKTNGNRAYHQIPVLSFGSNFFRRSDDGGNTWVTKTSGIAADLNNQNFYAPFGVDPGNGDRVLYGTFNVWETTNGGDNWFPLSSVGVNGWNSSGFNVDAIGLAASDGNTIYASANGHIFVTADHGASWVERSISGNPHVQDLQIDSGNPQIVYAVINQFNAGGTVFRTTNGGASWRNISGNLPNEPVWSLQIGEDKGTLYVGADDGVYATTNFGASWSRFGTGFPHAQVFQIELNLSLHILGAGTHGRGMWEIGVEADTRPAP